MKKLAACLLLQLALAGGAAADLANPATLTLQEVEPGRFTAELTLPVIQGRVAKARPILPDVCTAAGEPEVRGDATKAIRTWALTCDPARLTGSAVGMQGLLGTAMDVQLTLETLDGRRYVEQLRPTRAYFVIPEPPTFVELAGSAGRQAVERMVRRLELVLLILLAVLAGVRRRPLLLALTAFAAAQGLGQWLAGERWMVMSAFLPQAATAAAAWLVGMELLGQPVLRSGWRRPPAAMMLVLGALYGAARPVAARPGVARPETVPAAGLSSSEQVLAFVLFAAGTLAALLLLALWAHQLREWLTGLDEHARNRRTSNRWTSRLAHASVVLAGGLFFYRASTPYFSGAVDPAVPAAALVTAAALGLWCRRGGGASGHLLALLAAASGVAGVALSFHGALPLAPVAAFGSLALVGAGLLFGWQPPRWLAAALVALTALYQGHHAGQILRHDTTLPVANAVAMGVLLAAAFFVCYRSLPAGAAGPSLRVPGLLTLALAAFWQLAGHLEWLAGPVAADLAMGLVRLPLAALLLLIAAWLAWPRRRRFADGPETGGSGVHWSLLGLAFFALPLGTLRLDIPLHTPDAPSAAEAGRVLETLLTDTYLAFNLADEDAAFDRLAENLSQDLVADVYLDSRRRLTAGTREGAEVTVRDVRVVGVEDATGTGAGTGAAGTAFTYPCQWVVTARVRHLQHIHNRQNVYAGELTLRIEDERWKIAGLDLRSEERVVLSWKSS